MTPGLKEQAINKNQEMLQYEQEYIKERIKERLLSTERQKSSSPSFAERICSAKPKREGLITIFLRFILIKHLQWSWFYENIKFETSKAVWFFLIFGIKNFVGLAPFIFQCHNEKKHFHLKLPTAEHFDR